MTAAMEHQALLLYIADISLLTITIRHFFTFPKITQECV